MNDTLISNMSKEEIERNMGFFNDSNFKVVCERLLLIIDNGLDDIEISMEEIKETENKLEELEDWLSNCPVCL